MSENKTILKKVHELQLAMFNKTWTKDGKNRNQQYKYITEKQYKENFTQALKEVGLLWKTDVMNVEFLGQVSSSMHLVMAKFSGELIDPDTGESVAYSFYGSGADMGDKALYKAYTGGLKYFLANNFLVTEGNDPENDENILSPTPNYVPEEKREQIKDNLTSGQANEMQVKALEKLFKELLTADPSNKEYVQKILKDTSGLKNIGKKECEDLIIEVGKKIKEVK